MPSERESAIRSLSAWSEPTRGRPTRLRKELPTSRSLHAGLYQDGMAMYQHEMPTARAKPGPLPVHAEQAKQPRRVRTRSAGGRRRYVAPCLIDGALYVDTNGAMEDPPRPNGTMETRQGGAETRVLAALGGLGDRLSAGMFGVRVAAFGMAGMAPGVVRLVIGMGRIGIAGRCQVAI